MTNRRQFRYEVIVTRNDGSTDTVSCFGRRDAAEKRGSSIAGNKDGWPSVVSVVVADTMPRMIEGRFIHTVAIFDRK